jgi:hypothetical protein
VVIELLFTFLKGVNIYTANVLNVLRNQDFIKMVSFTPPPEVRKQAKMGIKCLNKGSKAGTRVGRYRATQLSNGKPVSLNTIKRMYSFFKRHEGNQRYTGEPCNDRGYVSWLLWGGDAGYEWSESILKERGLI